MKRLLFLLPFLLSQVFIQAQHLIPAQVDGGWGYMDKKNQTIVIQDFQQAKPVVQGLAIAQKNGKWGAFNEKLTVVIPFAQDRIRHLADGVFAAWQGDEVHLYGHRRWKRKTFQDAGLLKGTDHTLVLADDKGRYGLMTTKGKKKLPFQFCAPPEELEGNPPPTGS